jgi:hypothetical protein
MQSWNSRFNIADSKDNNKVHPFYRQLFDKPRGIRYVSVTSERSKKSSPRSRGRQLLKLSLAPRSDWDERFGVVFSKDNPYYPTPLREYFDNPRTSSASYERRWFDSQISPRSSRISPQILPQIDRRNFTAYKPRTGASVREAEYVLGKSY